MSMRLLFLIGGVLGLMGVTPLRADSIRLHEQAGSAQARVTLAQVAELKGEEAFRFADLVVLELTPQGDGLRGGVVTLPEVRARLQAAGANFARLSLRGYARCQVHPLQPQAGQEHHADPAATAAVVANPQGRTISTQTPALLREQVEAALRSALGADAEAVAIGFGAADERKLARGALQETYEITWLTPVDLGRVAVRIVRLEGGRPMETIQVSALLQRQVHALVVQQTLRRGEPILPGQVVLAPVVLDQPRSAPLVDAELVVGQVVSTLLRPGAVLYPEHLQAPLLVRRGDLVTVRCQVGGLMIRTVARAMEDGTLDQPITLRNERTRDVFAAVVAGHRQAVLPGQDAVPVQAAAQVPVAGAL